MKCQYRDTEQWCYVCPDNSHDGNFIRTIPCRFRGPYVFSDFGKGWEIDDEECDKIKLEWNREGPTPSI